MPQRKGSRSCERCNDIDQETPGELQQEGKRSEPKADDDADAERSSLPGGNPDEGKGNGHHRRHAKPIAPAGRLFVTEQQRRLDVADPQQRHNREQQRHENANRNALRCRVRTHAVLSLGQQRRRRSKRQRDRRDGGPGDGDAEKAARKPKRHHLQQIDGDNLAVASAHTFQDGDALDFLKHEHPDDARHCNAAEDDNHQADKAEVILRAIEIAAHLIVVRTIRPHVDEVVAEIAPQRPKQRLDSFVGNLRHDGASRPAAEAKQLRRRHVGIIDEHARPEAESSHAAAGLFRDHTTNGERRLADGNLVAHRQAERRQKFWTNEHAVLLDKRVRVRLPAL